MEGRPQKVQASGVVKIPPLPRETHPTARRWYLSLKQSGQAQYFEPSDWAAALLVADQMTRLLAQGNAINGPTFAGLWAAMNDLLTTEVARRRARIEVERLGSGNDLPEGVTAIDDYFRAAN